MPTCVNCGAANSLGDCCPDCACRDCDICGKTMDLDDDITVDGATYCEECIAAAIGVFRQTTGL